MAHPSGDKRFKILEATMKKHQFRQDALIEVLHAAQQLFGYLELDLLLFIARHLKLPPSRVYGIATFYHFFTLKPKGKHTCVVCTGTACYVKGADGLLAVLKREGGVAPGETTADGNLSVVLENSGKIDRSGSNRTSPPSGRRSPRTRASGSTSSATPTRATPGRS